MAQVGSGHRLYGLEPEDTILHFDTLDGRTLVEPSNRVYVYAPRFAAVRHVTGVHENDRLLRLSHVNAAATTFRVDDLQIANTVDQPVGARRQIGTKPASVLEEHLPGITLHNVQRLVQQRHRFQPFEDFTVIRHGVLEETERVQLAEKTQAAAVWTHNQAVQLIIDGQEAEVDTSHKSVQEVVRFKLAGKPRMRVVKVASTAAAKPGELIDFTIRFDNIGSQAVDNVTIVDNLSPRLEYVPDTVECTVAAEFLSAANAAESLVLRWQIIDPLPPGQGGIIRFRCLVR